MNICNLCSGDFALPKPLCLGSSGDFTKQHLSSMVFTCTTVIKAFACQVL